jgi:hypothetical protein
MPEDMVLDPLSHKAKYKTKNDLKVQHKSYRLVSEETGTKTPIPWRSTRQ